MKVCRHFFYTLNYIFSKYFSSLYIITQNNIYNNKIKHFIIIVPYRNNIEHYLSTIFNKRWKNTRTELFTFGRFKKTDDKYRKGDTMNILCLQIFQIKQSTIRAQLANARTHCLYGEKEMERLARNKKEKRTSRRLVTTSVLCLGRDDFYDQDMLRSTVLIKSSKNWYAL